MSLDIPGKKIMKEICIRCGKETEYAISAPVNMRKYYIEGSGQLCEQCFYELYPVPASLQRNLGNENTTNENPPTIPKSI